MYFYEPLTRALRCRIAVFHGVENSKALIADLIINDSPYGVILDGDYAALNPTPPPHRNVVILDRYSFENYLWEESSINKACLRHAQNGDKIDVISKEFDMLTKHLAATMADLIALDIAARESGASVKVLPDRVEQLLHRPDSPKIDGVKVGQIISKVTGSIDSKAIAEAKAKLNKYLKSHRLTHIIKGHVLLGVISRLFTRTATTIRGKKSLVSDDTLTQLLSDMVWSDVPSLDHKRLKRKVRSLASELNRTFPQMKHD